MRNLITNLRDLAHVAVDELVAHLPGAHPHVTTDEPTTRLCVITGRPHRATDGLLCRHHLEELGTWLHDIEDEADRLSWRAAEPDAWAALPSMSIRWDSTGGGSLASQQSPVVLDALVHTDPRSSAHGWQHDGPVCAACQHVSCAWIRADADEHDAQAERPLYVLGVLQDLADRVREERQLRRPDVHVIARVPAGARGPFVADAAGVIGVDHVHPQQATVRTERQLLTRNLDWIASQPWVAAMREELRDLRTQLQRLNRNEDDRPLTGWCYKAIDDQGTECGGQLWPLYVEHTSSDDEQDDGPLRPREVVCDRNPAHRWTGGRGGDLARLSLILAAQQREEDARAAVAAPVQAAPPAPAVPASTNRGAARGFAALLEARHLGQG